MPLTEEIMHTHVYDKVDEYNLIHYTQNYYKQDKLEETLNDIYIYIYSMYYSVLKRLLQI